VHPNPLALRFVSKYQPRSSVFGLLSCINTVVFVTCVASPALPFYDGKFRNPGLGFINLKQGTLCLLFKKMAIVKFEMNNCNQRINFLCQLANLGRK
jgi:hypothetical protein